MGRVGEYLAALLAVLAVVVAPYINSPPVIALIVILGAIVLFAAFQTRYVTVTLIALAALYGLSLLPLFIFACTVVIIITGEIIFTSLGDRPLSYLCYIIGATVTAGLTMVYLSMVSPLTLVIGIIVAVLLKAIVHERREALVLEALGLAVAMLVFQAINYQADFSLLALAVVITSVFVVLSYRTRTANISGMFSAALIGILLIVFANVCWFIIMLFFFILGSAATRYRYSEKQKLGVEQSHGGARGYVNVFSNGLVGAVAAVLFGVTGGNPLAAALFVGSVATATADTVAGEIGVTGGWPYLITSLRKVAPGTNGAVSLLGEGAGLAGSAAICLSALALGIVRPETAVICTFAGFIGSNLDSVFGEVIENRGFIGNGGTNFLSTLGGGTIAAVMSGFV